MADTSEANATSAATGYTGKAGIYLAVLQLVFTLGWTIYVVYLPQLAAKAGISAGVVIIILMLDQAIFTVTDTLMGIAADRMTLLAGRLSRFVAVATVMSCAAFLALPFVADLGAQAQPVFVTLIVIWAITSSALRAPPLALLGKFAARPSVPWLAALAMLGYGIAGAVSPYLGVTLRNVDPRIPFAVSSIVLLVTALGLSWIERNVRAGALQPSPRPQLIPPRPVAKLTLVFVVVALVLALGYQFHFSINSAPLFLRFAKQPELEWLMPVYWIGFNIAMLPASFITRRLGGLMVMGVAGLLGAGAVVGVENAGSLDAMVTMQFIAGAAWGCILMSAVAAAIAVGGDGSEGKVLGLMFSAIALATFARMAAVAAGVAKDPAYEALLHFAPIVCWLLGGAVLLVLAAIRLRRWRGGLTESPA